jgi:hypothetical protein
MRVDLEAAEIHVVLRTKARAALPNLNLPEPFTY